MPDHGEGGEPTRPTLSDQELQVELAFVEFRDTVTTYLDPLYQQSHPDVRWDCEQFAEHLALYSFDSLGISDQYATHPGTAELLDIYKRLIFVFTNPADLNDGVDESDIHKFISSISVTLSRDDHETNMQLFIRGLEIRTMFLLANAVEFEQAGTFADMSYAARFKYTQQRTMEYLNSFRPEDS